MKNFIYILIVAVVIAALWLLFNATQPQVATSPSSSNTGQISTVPATSSAPSSAPTVDSAYFSERMNSTLGTYLTDKQGLTLYTFANDTAGVPTCVGACAAKWPAYGPGLSATSTAPINLPMLPAGVSTVKGANGMVQFTWQNMPLYYYFEDKAPGDTFGQGVGGVWYVVKL